MKTHHLILLSTALFICLFYDEFLGLNVGIFGLAIALLTLLTTPKNGRTKSYLALFVCAVISAGAYAWYGDLPSFFAVAISLFLLRLKSKYRNLNALFAFPLVLTNGATFIFRFFHFERWLPKSSGGNMTKTIALLLIPGVFVALFFGIYAMGSTHFLSLFSGYQWNLDIWKFLVIATIGFFLCFNFWNFAVERFIFKQNRLMDEDFDLKIIKPKPTWDFLDIESERLSGLITFGALNLLLLIFIITFNYEQFVEVPKTPKQLSGETHERVTAVILSIIMAIVVIMFYFKSTFNFDAKAGALKAFAYVWLGLNVVLVLSALLKNSEYVLNLGLTYKRLGVYAFLLLSQIGLSLTFYKILKKKTNAFLFNRMFWYF